MHEDETRMVCARSDLLTLQQPSYYDRLWPSVDPGCEKYGQNLRESGGSSLQDIIGNSSLHPLDQFERAWSSGQVPDLPIFVKMLSDAGEVSAVSELFQIDMEHRWRTSHAGIARFFARDYLMQFAQTLRDHDAIELICWEYHVRNHWGDYPSFQILLAEWPQYRPELDAAIQNTANSLERPVVTISGTQTRPEPFFLDGVLEVGRQTSDEPAPFGRIPRPDGCRLIVVSNSDNSVSRRQLSIARDTQTSVLIRNTSRNRAVAVIGARILDAGESASCSLPIRIHLGGRLMLSIAANRR